MQQKLILLNEHDVCNIDSYIILFIFASLHLPTLYFNVNIILTAYLHSIRHSNSPFDV